MNLKVFMFVNKLCLSLVDRQESALNSLRTFPQVAFFHDGVTTSEIDLRFNMPDAQRRARAIATAPRRNRYDDDDEEEGHSGQKKSKRVE